MRWSSILDASLDAGRVLDESSIQRIHLRKVAKTNFINDFKFFRYWLRHGLASSLEAILLRDVLI